VLLRTIERLRDDPHGSVLVEAAITIPLFATVMFGGVEMGLATRDKTALTGSAMAGARAASIFPRTNLFADEAARSVQAAGIAIPNGTLTEMWVYEAGADGYPSTTPGQFAGCGNRCIRYTYDQGARRFNRAGGNWDPNTINACPGGGRTIVGTMVRARHNFVTGMFGAGLNLTDHATAAFEPIPNALGPQCA